MRRSFRLSKPIRFPNGIRLVGFYRPPDDGAVQLLVLITRAVARAEAEGRTA